MPLRLFENDELRARAERARALMEEQELDALLVTGDFSAGMNYYYLSGHLPRDYQLNYSRPHVMVLPREGDAFLYVYGVNAENARMTSWVEEILTYDPPFSGEGLAKAMAERGLGSARIGCELGTDQRLFIPVADFRALEEALSRATFADAAPLIWRLRMIKSPPEVEYVRRADAINAHALREGFARTRGGDSEVDAARAIGAAMVEGGSYRPPYGQILVVSQAKSRALGHTARMLGPLEDFTLSPGDLLFVDSGAVVAGYWGEFNRMAVVGPPSERQRHHHAAIVEVVERSIDEAIRPGESFHAVIERMTGFYRDAGLGEDQYANYIGPPYMHLCHGIGLASSEPPFVRHDSEDVLEAGMIVSVEAYLRDEGMTYGTESDVVITEEGCELLSEPDPGLFELEA